MAPTGDEHVDKHISDVIPKRRMPTMDQLMTMPRKARRQWEKVLKFKIPGTILSTDSKNLRQK